MKAKLERSILARPAGTLAKLTKPEAFAVTAALRGDATPEQAKRALLWVMNRVAQVTHVSGGLPHEMAFCEGRRSVGVEIGQVASLTGAEIEALED